MHLGFEGTTGKLKLYSMHLWYSEEKWAVGPDPGEVLLHLSLTARLKVSHAIAQWLHLLIYKMAIPGAPLPFWLLVGSTQSHISERLQKV